MGLFFRRLQLGTQGSPEQWQWLLPAPPAQEASTAACTSRVHMLTLNNRGAALRTATHIFLLCPKLCFQLEGQPNFPVKVETGRAWCHQTHHLNEGKEFLSLTAALPHTSPAQTKLTPGTHLFIMVLLPPSLGCCCSNSEILLSRAMPHGLGV